MFSADFLQLSNQMEGAASAVCAEELGGNRCQKPWGEDVGKMCLELQPGWVGWVIELVGLGWMRLGWVGLDDWFSTNIWWTCSGFCTPVGSTLWWALDQPYSLPLETIQMKIQKKRYETWILFFTGFQRFQRVIFLHWSRVLRAFSCFQGPRFLLPQEITGKTGVFDGLILGVSRSWRVETCNWGVFVLYSNFQSEIGWVHSINLL